MSQKQPGCLQALVGIGVLACVGFFMCGGCMKLAQKAADDNAAVEAAKSPEQKAKEKADAAEAALETALTIRATKAVKESLEYPLNSTIHMRTQFGKKGDDTRAVLGKVDASNAFGVKKTVEWMVLFKKDGDKWVEIRPVVFGDGAK